MTKTKFKPKTVSEELALDPELLAEEFKKRLQHWRVKPLDFAREVFGFKPSNQQYVLFNELGRLVSAKMKRDEGLELDIQEQSYAKKRGISIRSGKGTGKDAAAAIVVCWFLFCFPMSKTYMLAPSMDNLKSNLMAELSMWLARRTSTGERQCKLAEEFEVIATGCRLKADPDRGKHWFATCNSAGPNMPEDQQVEVLQGKHARYMMFVIDEASGVPDAVFRPLDTTLTDPVNFILMLYNPTRRSGFAYDTHFSISEKKHWISLHWNSEESDMITPDQIQYLREKYGEDSNQYKVSVLGIPPSADDGSLIPYEWCLDAAGLEFEEQEDDPVVFGVDVARMGKDSSIILVRKGPVVKEIQELKQLDTVELSRWVAMRAADWQPQAIYVDAVGLGIGVVDELNRQGIPNVYAVNVSKASRKPGKYSLLRDELWWQLREKFERNQISLAECPDEELISELSSIKFEVRDNGKVKIESKQDMRKRNMPSPNKGDALMLTMMVADKAYVKPKEEPKEREPLDRVRSKRLQCSSRLSWLEV